MQNQYNKFKNISGKMKKQYQKYINGIIQDNLFQNQAFKRYI